MAFTLITITGTYKTPGGAVAAGSVSLTPSRSMVNGADIREPIPVWATLNGAGAISVQVAATNDPGTTPTGVTYGVVELINNAKAATYSMAVPFNGGAIDLSSIAH